MPWPEWIGTPLQAGSLTVLVAIFALVVRWQLGLRKLKIEADQVEINAQEVANADEADIRDHYAEEVKGLRDALQASANRHLERERLTDHRHRRALLIVENRYRRLLHESDEKHDICQRDRDILRDRVQALKEQQSGLVRLILQNNVSGALQFDDSEISDLIREAAARVDLAFEKRLGGRDGDENRGGGDKHS